MMNNTRQLWTPLASASVPGDLSVAYTIQNGVWAQAGSIVRMGFDLRFTPTYTTAAGTFIITNLPALPPVPDLTLSAGEMGFFLNTFAWPTGTTQINPVFSSFGGQISIVLTCSGTGVVSANVPMSAFPSGSPMRFNGSISLVVPD